MPYRNLSKTRADLNAVYEVSKALATSLDVTKTFREALNYLLQACDWRRGFVLVAEHGGRAVSYLEDAGARIMKHAELSVRIDLARGKVAATVWTCDFSYDYVKINADYRS